MKTKSVDWLLGKTLPEQDVMCVNIIAKIDKFEMPYDLTKAWISEFKLICQTFHDAYTQVIESRATGKQRDSWFNNLREGEPKGSPAPAAPVFGIIALPAGASVGLYDQLRDKVDFFKSNEVYTKADGDDLMITSPEGVDSLVDDKFPELKPTEDVSGDVLVGYPKDGFDGAELQWREVGATMWQAADKSTETIIRFKPNVSTPGVPVKIELRAVYLIKNMRVGKWSPTYTLTIG